MSNFWLGTTAATLSYLAGLYCLYREGKRQGDEEGYQRGKMEGYAEGHKDADQFWIGSEVEVARVREEEAS